MASGGVVTGSVWPTKPIVYYLARYRKGLLVPVLYQTAIQQNLIFDNFPTSLSNYHLFLTCQFVLPYFSVGPKFCLEMMAS